MLLKRKYFFRTILSASVALLFLPNLLAQRNMDTSVYLTRLKIGGTSIYKIPVTNFYFVNDAGLSKDYSNGWIMKWDIIKKANSNLLFLEMNSTDVEGWLGNEYVSGSVQLVYEIPKFFDSISFNNVTNKSSGLHIINNYSGNITSKKYVDGELKINRTNDNVYISSSINLITENPKTKQQFYFTNKQVQSVSFDEYQKIQNIKDSLKELETNEMSNDLAESIISRDSIWEIENNRIKDSLKLHPYLGKFRFWASNIDKAGYSRNTYSIINDSLIIKGGPYDFIYLAKNYPEDSILYKKPLTETEQKSLKGIETLIGIGSLENSYDNFCIMDGLILSFSFESAKFSKDVTISNYYNPTIATVIEFINKISPKKYHIWYDKRTLLKQQSDCDNRKKTD